MKINIKNIQNLDSEQIMTLLLPKIENIYNDMKYMEISKEEFYNLVLKEIENSKINYNGDIDYAKYIISKIDAILVNEIKEKLLEDEIAIKIINNYINKNLIISTSYNICIENLNKLNPFFEKYDYVPNSDVLINLVKNNQIFSKIIEVIVKKDKNKIISGNMEEIFNNNIIVSIIETFCMLNNIEIKEIDVKEENFLDDFDFTDSVDMYLQEINRRPLLSKEEERNLALKIAEGDNYAKEIFIESNLKLVVSIARRYLGRGLSFLDLIQEGNIGLMIAVERFDVTKENKFSTYASYWIKQSINIAINNKGRNIRIPVYMNKKISDYRKMITNLEARLNRHPTINEIIKESNLLIPEIVELHKLQNDTLSLNMLVGNTEDEEELENFISLEQEDIEDVTIKNIAQNEVIRLLEKCDLTTREMNVLIMRFGINNTIPLTLDEIGKKYNLSRERIRQIEAKALMKIRKSEYIELLAVYMQNPDKALENIEYFREKYKDSKYSKKSYYKVK